MCLFSSFSSACLPLWWLFWQIGYFWERTSIFGSKQFQCNHGWCTELSFLLHISFVYFIFHVTAIWIHGLYQRLVTSMTKLKKMNAWFWLVMDYGVSCQMRWWVRWLDILLRYQQKLVMTIGSSHGPAQSAADELLTAPRQKIVVTELSLLAWYTWLVHKLSA